MLEIFVYMVPITLQSDAAKKGPRKVVYIHCKGIMDIRSSHPAYGRPHVFPNFTVQLQYPIH